MKKVQLFFLLAGLGLIFACSNETTNSRTFTRFSTSPLNFGTENFVQQESNCLPKTACLQVNLQYPVAQAGKIGVRNAINEYIQQKYIRSLASEQQIQNDSIHDLHFAAKAFLHNFQQQRQQQPTQIHRWQKYSNARVLHQTEKYVSLELPISTRKSPSMVHTETQLISFDTTSGFPIHVEDLILEKEAFQARCEAAITKAHQLQHPTQKINREALQLDTVLEFKEKFAFGLEGLYCLYDPKDKTQSIPEPLAFTIPYEDLTGILDLRYQE
ncbi:MAG: hypothetical protein AB8G15_16240 [Saprospiraceae bacterium]